LRERYCRKLFGHCYWASAVPYSQGFESGTTPLPLCWTQSTASPTVSNGWYVETGTQTYNRQPRTGSYYLVAYYSPTTSWAFSGPITLVGGITYNLSCYYITDGIATWYTFSTNYGTSPASGSMTAIASVSSPVNTTYQPLSGNFTPATSGTYYLGFYQNNSGGPWDLTVDDVSLTIPCTAPTITGTTPGSRCGTGTVGLSATASAGTISWWAASTGGTALATGNSYTTPSISTTTTYYVDATNAGCTTPTRTAITATVNSPAPSGGSITGSTSVCAGSIGQVYTFTAGGGGGTPTSWSWTVPSGASITAGGGTSSITVTFGSTTGNVACTPSNSCGSGTAVNYAVTVIGNRISPVVRRF